MRCSCGGDEGNRKYVIIVVETVTLLVVMTLFVVVLEKLWLWL